MSHKKPDANLGMLSGLIRSRAKRQDTSAQLKRKNLTLDQHRIDLLKARLGASTESEAITTAMDIVLEMVSFESEIRLGNAKLLGRGGFTNLFDDEASLDFSGFRDVPQPAARRE